MSFQINTRHPNSVQNTCVFAVLEASNSVMNLKVALGMYKEQVDIFVGGEDHIHNTVHVHVHVHVYTVHEHVVERHSERRQSEYEFI